ncbi:cytidine deaminase [Salinisphaera hydrothermalis C41B8]|uniref:Cytidine deaminase n=1 Tax=Salinisphaera hydrothermalis (strain C41B8) TaxID=1304275 RepID=A0A084IQY3_SALHC|nr:cytidine deaminase [Salinisphaera hydrothermalis C41B8]
MDQALVDAAKAQAIASFPSGEGGAAAVYLSDGTILTSVGFESPNEAANLCYETGAYCEAFRLGKSVTASVCVIRCGSEEPFAIVPPCGICLERLAIWRESVEVAVPDREDSKKWQSLPFREIQPFYWAESPAFAGDT